MYANLQALVELVKRAARKAGITEWRHDLPHLKMLQFPEERINRIEEAQAKYETVDQAFEEIRKLALEPYGSRGVEANGAWKERTIHAEDLDEFSYV